MSEASFASLNPTLLARKGGAKPAMRPQLHPLPETTLAAAIEPEMLEDLGWNDMGADAEGPRAHSAQVHHLNAAVTGQDHDADIAGDTDPLGAEPPAKVSTALTAIASDHDAIVAAAKQARDHADPQKSSKARTKPAGKRAAFTLRLDSERHLKLRLAATMQGKSAQALVTEALDGMLSQIQDLDVLAARMKQP